MADTKDPIWFRSLDRFGVAVLALIFVAVCTYNIGAWIAPQIEKVIGGHLEFMQRTAENGQKAAKAVEESHVVQKQISEAIREIKSVEQLQTDHARESLDMQREVLDELKKSKALPPQTFFQSKSIPFVWHQSQ